MSAILLCITAGRGPAECRKAVQLVLRRLCEEAEGRGVDISVDSAANEQASLLVSLGGEDAERYAASWEGTIQWSARSGLRKGTGRKNWFVAVKRVPIPAAVPVLSCVRFETLRAGGPGGQHQNKTESAVRAIHVPSGLSVTARDGRSQHRNKALAMLRLQQLLAAVYDQQAAKANAQDWLNRIAVERGSPVRIYEGPDFVLRQRG